MKKSVTMYETTFSEAVWQSENVSIQSDYVEVSFRLYHDSDAADARETSLNKTARAEIQVIEDPPNGTLTAVMAAVSSYTNEERLSILANAVLDVVADIEIANESSELYDGSKV